MMNENMIECDLYETLQKNLNKFEGEELKSIETWISMFEKTIDRYTVTENDVYWIMKWDTTKYPDMPENELIFQENPALAILLLTENVILNEFWWKKDWPEEAKKKFAIALNINDIFCWGCSDAENLNYEDLQDVYDHYLKDKTWGTAVWACKRRNMLPQKPVYDEIMKQGIWNLDDMGLEPNTFI